MTTTVDTASPTYTENREALLEKIDDLAEQHAKALAGGVSLLPRP